MPQVQQYYSVLAQKLKPSIDIQAMGSTNIPIRRSTLFGPQIRTTSWTSFIHKQAPSLVGQLNLMNK